MDKRESAGKNMADQKESERELLDVFRLFYDSVPVSFETIDSSRGDTDFREAVIAVFESGDKSVVKLADNGFTNPEKIKMWKRTALEYRRLGYYCPKIMPDKTGNYPSVHYKGHRCTAYAEEYSPYRSADTFEKDKISAEEYTREMWIMTAKVAAEYFSYTDAPSGYCLFDVFCPSDQTDEVLEDALEWRKYSQTLPEEFQEQVSRIWRLWTENRKALEPVYRTLPTSVFQADLNSTNLLLDEFGKFVGVYDFNLCGREVFLTYLFRETFHCDFKKELNAIFSALKISGEYYRFSEIEKRAALMLYRCIKPLGANKLWRLKQLSDDRDAIRAYLHETENSLTEEIDFSFYMNSEKEK